MAKEFVNIKSSLKMFYLDGQLLITDLACKQKKHALASDSQSYH